LSWKDPKLKGKDAKLSCKSSKLLPQAGTEVQLPYLRDFSKNRCAFALDRIPVYRRVPVSFASYAFIPPPIQSFVKVGPGGNYMQAFRDKDGNYFDGGKKYRMRVPANGPAEQFWARRTLCQSPNA
jgi:hypothetical protein